MAYINVDEVYILDNTGLQVDMATDIPFADAGFSDAQKEQARKNIGAGGSNRNLLDNWYFVGGGSQLGDGVFPINQRGQTSYTGTQVGIDRWQLSNGNTSVSLSSSGMTIYTNGSGYGYGGQALNRSFTRDGKYTFSVLLADGTLYTTPSDTNLTLPSGLLFYFSNDTSVNWRNPANTTCETIAAMKLEKGTVSTLVNDVPPDFYLELEKAKAHYFHIADEAFVCLSNSSANTLTVYIPVTTTMASNVSIQSVTGSFLRGSGVNGVPTLSASNITLENKGNMLKLNITNFGVTIAGTTIYMLNFADLVISDNI